MKNKKIRATLPTPKSKNRCNFQFADGRRCRMLLHKTTGQLCLFHQRELLQLQSAAEIGAELLALGGNFKNPIAINFVLGKLFAHVATGRMHRRDASTLAYIAQLLLQTLDQKRYSLARDRHDYRAFKPAIGARYGHPKSKRRSSTVVSYVSSPAPSQSAAFAAGSSPASVAAGLQSRPAGNSSTARPDSLGTPISRLASSSPTTQTAPTTTNPNRTDPAETSDAIRAQYPPPANPQFPEPLPDTPWFRKLVLERRALAQQQQQQNPSAKL
jgi:hypothetical protein